MESHRPTCYDIASHFYVSHINGAVIPGTRLSKVLESMFHRRPLTALSLKYLQELNLTRLHQLASGQLTYEAFIEGLDPELVTRERAADAQRQALEKERRAEADRWAQEAERKRNAIKAARAAREVDRIAEDAERKAKDEARLAQWTEQDKRNRVAAEAFYEARIRDPDYSPLTPHDIACHYHIDNHPSAVRSPFSNILWALYQGHVLSPAYINYLKVKGFTLLYKLATGQITYESYISSIHAAEAAKKTRIAQLKARRLQRETVEAARIARERDPAYILRKKYGIVENSEQPLVLRLMNVLQHVEAGNRIAERDFVWLNAEGKRYFTKELREAYHFREAEFCAREYIRTRDPWNVINASGHYRKCKQPESAQELIGQVPAKSLKHPKIHSAMLTTHGGVLRDLKQRKKGLQFGIQAHELQPKNFRPCTLLGALNIELGNFSEGHDWYAKAEKLGASKQSIDTELKGIFRRADKTLRETMRTSLLAIDPVRYRWVDEKSRV
ncbi:hypothetical protein FE848_17835 [Marinobacter sp. 1-3A]|uniref:cell envelope integrity protein TolA n=1 Tax=Marinobacter sp. 1-3A TaxID=2582920 RepID=UPI001906098E|nr:hypothetical protein [Marinobacter sp. 1-3A]MBK1875090.1 hypothetical protein [Marinobacter sp. 1-3A]